MSDFQGADPRPQGDHALDEVEAWFRAKPDYAMRFATTLRRALDEVIDGMRTGRWCVADLEKTEKTYVGTKVEILLRYEFEISKGRLLDFEVAGHQVDAKCTVGKNWTIPDEAVDEICLLVRIDDARAHASVGLLRVAANLLNPGENRDGKRSIRTKQQGLIRWLLKEHAIETHILATLTEDDRLSILAPKGGQARVNELFRRVNDRIISRNAIETVARQLDPMKRMRDARLELEDEGIRILGHQDGDPDEARRLGLPVPNKGEAIATRRT